MHVRIYRQKRSPYWYVDYVYEGQRCRYSLGVKDEKHARLRANEIEKELALGLDPVKEPTTKIRLGDLFAEYLRYCEKTVNARTVGDRRRYCKRLLKYFGDIPLTDISKTDIQKYIDSRIGETGNRTINEEYKTIRQAFNYAVARGMLEDNKVRGIKLLSEKRRPIRVLSETELRTWLDWCRKEDPLLYDLSVVAANTGLRKSDIIKIRGEDIGIENKILTVGVSKLDGEELYIPLNKEAVGVLERLKAPGYIFQGRNAPHLVDFKRRFHRAREATGIDFKFSDFRHTFATRLLIAGVDIYTVSKILGHKTITTTIRYLEIVDERKHRAVDRLGEN